MADIRDDDRLFAAVGQRTSIGTTELPVAFLKNPSGSSRTLKLKQMVYNNSHTVSSNLRVRLYVNPTTSANGTSGTIVALDVGSGNSPSAEFYTSPTVSANGSQIYDTMVPGGSSARAGVIDFPAGFQIRANNTLLATAVSDGTGRIANITFVWEES